MAKKARYLWSTWFTTCEPGAKTNK